MTTFEHVLHGCAPVPLAGYLKALGVFRLIAEQADPEVRGLWRDERFVLGTRLSEDELVAFLVEKYEPTPVVAPWNGGSGFWPKDNREGLDAIRASITRRLASYRAAIGNCVALIRESGMTAAPKEKSKASLITALRGFSSEKACWWLDGAVALTVDGPRYPPLLGTGGNDGRLDFSNNFMRHVAKEIAPTGKARSLSEDMVRSALFSRPSAGLDRGAVGQFAPGGAGGPNAGVGFEAESLVSPWDFILTVEGALAFAAAAVRRNAQDYAAALAFPFATRAFGSGSGALAPADEAEARAEFWAPLWSRPAEFREVCALMTEGRVVLDGRSARDSLEFARAIALLGVARGIDDFHRYGFVMRAGRAYFATPLGRIRVRENPHASLISELDAGRWLSRVRRAAREKEGPASLRALVRQLDDALFALAADGSHDAVQQALIAVGTLALHAGHRAKPRNGRKPQEAVPPPPRLSRGWAEAADDGSYDFALAAALASIDAATEAAPDGRVFRMPFRRHLAALVPLGRRDEWDDTTESRALAVWTGRDLLRDLLAVLERRLTEAQRRSFVCQGGAELPLRGRRTAPLAAVAAFLADRTDDDRIATLTAGLGWARSGTVSQSLAEREDVVPLAYAALKPLFDPRGVGPTTDERRFVDPLPLIRLLRGDRARDSVALAQRLARGAGLPTPFAKLGGVPAADPARLTAALLFPISPMAYGRLVARAYPNLTRDEEDSDAA